MKTLEQHTTEKSKRLKTRHRYKNKLVKSWRSLLFFMGVRFARHDSEGRIWPDKIVHRWEFRCWRQGFGFTLRCVPRIVSAAFQA